MKDCGITRRVDELGRIVLPRELRKSFKIDVGAKMQIFVNDDGDIVLRKSTELKDKTEYDRIVSALSSIIEHDILITDREKVLASSKRRFLDKALTTEAYDIVRKHDSVIKKRTDGAMMIGVIENEEPDYSCELFVPIIREGDSIGAIIVLAESGANFASDSVKLCKAFALMLSLVD